MPKNEDGEFELILGNRQLLSVFFIVVVLLTVFFTMGYIVGRNSGGGSEVASVKKADKPLEIPPATRTPVETPVPSPPTPTPGPTTTEPKVDPSTPEAIAVSSSKPEPPKPEPVKPEPPKPEPPKPKEKEKPVEKPQEKPKPVEANSGSPQQPVSGQTYLQVAAVGRPEAELMTEVLGRKGFKAIHSQIPEKPALYRVLVGPYKDAAAITQAREELQKAGLKGFDAIKRTF